MKFLPYLGAFALCLHAANASPRINEFLAVNGGPIVDVDGDESDWIEIKNTAVTPIDLAGWHLTDGVGTPTEWTFPAVELPPGGFLLVFASGKDRSDPAAELHTNFKLSGGGEYLALVGPDGVTVSQSFNPFPPQYTGISYGIGNGGSAGYFTAPTPGGENGATTVSGFIEEPVEFSHNRGFYEAPFQLTLTTAAAGAQIYYTTDASEPSTSNGTLYTGPIDITTTATIRAGAFTATEGPFKSNTSTFIFLDDVLDQPNDPAGYPDRWQSTVVADYAFDKSVAPDAELKAALRALPTVSLVMEIDDWFDPSTDPAVGGIYSNSVIARGEVWERPVSAEFFDFPHGQEAQVNCGIRIFGNASRATSRKKHNMRLVFRSSYGPSKFEFPLFGGDSEPDIVNGYLFRGQNGDSWFHPNSTQQREALYIRDQLARDLQAEMGQPNTKQDHVHLYINGLYWGVMNTIERIEAESHQQAFGGQKESWDSLKSSRTPSSRMYSVDGTLDAWNELIALAQAGVEEPEEYAAIQEHIELENFIDFLLLNFYNGNRDWDDNNFQCARRNDVPDQWRFFVWDSERTILGNTVDNTTRNHTTRATGVHQKLRANEEYRLKFADRIHKHMFNGGALTPASVRRVFDQWVDFLREPLKAESARWGDAQRSGNPYTVDNEWQAEVDRRRNSYFPGRTATAFNQLKNQGLYPDTDAPSYNQHGGNVASGFALSMSAPAGTIYYTLDGSDPRMPATVGEEVILVDEVAPATAYLPSDGSLGDSWQAIGFDDGAWLQGSTAVGFEASPDTYDPLINLHLTGMQGNHASAYVRIPFDIADQEALDAIGQLTLNLKYEDGFICYINGTRVGDSGNFPEPVNFNTDSDTRSDLLALEYEPFDISTGIGALVVGENILAFQLMNSSAGNSDLLLLPQLIAQPATAAGISPRAQIYDGPIQLDHPVVANARVLVGDADGDGWSALNSATFLVDTVPADSNNLAITEINYHPQSDDDGEEFVELTNIGDQNIDLAGLRFTAGLTFDVDSSNLRPTATLAPGQSLIIVGNLQDFPGDPDVLGSFRGDLSNDGERIRLEDGDGNTIREFTYSDRLPWPESADGEGFTLTLIDPPSNPDHALPSSWHASSIPGGNPGSSATATYPGGGVSILDYALAGNLPTIELSEDNSETTFSFVARSDAEDVAFAIESSTDLSQWEEVTDSFTALDPVDNGDGTVTVRFEADADGPRRFLRLRATLR